MSDKLCRLIFLHFLVRLGYLGWFYPGLLGSRPAAAGYRVRVGLTDRVAPSFCLVIRLSGADLFGSALGGGLLRTVGQADPNELLAKRKRKEIQTLTSSMNLVSSLDEPAFRQSTLF